LNSYERLTIKRRKLPLLLPWARNFTLIA